MELNRLDSQNRRWAGYLAQDITVYVYFDNVTEIRDLPDGLIFANGKITGRIEAEENQVFEIDVVANSVTPCELHFFVSPHLSFAPRLEDRDSIKIGELDPPARYDGFQLQPVIVPLVPYYGDEVDMGSDLNFVSIVRTLDRIEFLDFLPPGMVWDNSKWSLKGRVYDTGYWTTRIRVHYTDVKLSTSIYGAGSEFVVSGTYNQSLYFAIKSVDELPETERSFFADDFEELGFGGEFTGNPRTDFHPSNRCVQVFSDETLSLKLMFRSVRLSAGYEWPEGLTFNGRTDLRYDTLKGALPVGEWKIKIEEDFSNPLLGYTIYELAIQCYPPEDRIDPPPESQSITVDLGYFENPTIYEIWAGIPTTITVNSPSLQTMTSINRLSITRSGPHFFSEWKNAGWNTQIKNTWRLAYYGRVDLTTVLSVIRGLREKYGTITFQAFKRGKMYTTEDGIRTVTGGTIGVYSPYDGMLLSVWSLHTSTGIHSPHPVNVTTNNPTILYQNLEWESPTRVAELLKITLPEDVKWNPSENRTWTPGAHDGFALITTTSNWTTKTRFPLPRNDVFGNTYINLGGGPGWAFELTQVPSQKYWYSEDYWVNPWNGKNNNSGYYTVGGQSWLGGAFESEETPVVPYNVSEFVGTSLEGDAQFQQTITQRKRYFYRNENEAHNVTHVSVGRVRLLATAYPSLPACPAVAEPEVVKLTPKSPLDYEPIHFDCFQAYRDCNLQPQLLPHAVGGIFRGNTIEESLRPVALKRETVQDLVWNSNVLTFSADFTLWIKGYSASSGIEEDISVSVDFEMHEIRNHATVEDRTPNADTKFKNVWTYVQETTTVFERDIVTTIEIFGSDDTSYFRSRRSGSGNDISPQLSISIEVEAQDGGIYTLQTEKTDKLVPFKIILNTGEQIPLYLKGSGVILSGESSLDGIGDAYEECVPLEHYRDNTGGGGGGEPSPPRRMSVTFSLDMFDANTRGKLFLRDNKTMGADGSMFERMTIYSTSNTIMGSFLVGQYGWRWKIDSHHGNGGYVVYPVPVKFVNQIGYVDGRITIGFNGSPAAVFSNTRLDSVPEWMGRVMSIGLADIHPQATWEYGRWWNNTVGDPDAVTFSYPPSNSPLVSIVIGTPTVNYLYVNGVTFYFLPWLPDHEFPLHLVAEGPDNRAKMIGHDVGYMVTRLKNMLPKITNDEYVINNDGSITYSFDYPNVPPYPKTVANGAGAFFTFSEV